MTDRTTFEPRRSRRTSRLALRGIDVALHEWGDAAAPAMVYLHGWADCGPTFQFVVDAFARDWHVLAPDLRGFGDTQAVTSGYWFPDYLADLDRLLDALSPVDPVRLVGHSMGANVAGLYAGSVPERIAAFVNIEGFGLPDSDPADAPGRYREWLHAARTLDGFATFPDYAALARRIAKRNPRLTPERAAFVARCWGRDAGGEVRLKADPLHKLPNPVLYRRAEAIACWQAIRAPTLLLAGTESEIRRRLVAAAGSIGAAVPVPGAVELTVPGSGHMLHFEAPEATAAAIETFLATCL